MDEMNKKCTMFGLFQLWVIDPISCLSSFLAERLELGGVSDPLQFTKTLYTSAEDFKCRPHPNWVEPWLSRLHPFNFFHCLGSAG
jgi:hypothetical protein